MPARKNYIGVVYGRLTVIKEIAPTNLYANGRKDRRFLCRCECGKEKEVTRNLLLAGSTKSCGCLAKELQTTHGMSGTSTYRIWWGMMCRHKGHTCPKHYKERGIQVCKRWHTFENFFKDMGVVPKSENGKNATLERINNSEGYSPKNCKWASTAEQARNKRSNRKIHYKGRNWCLTDLADKYGIPRSTLRYRLNTGMSVTDALQNPINRRPVKFRRKTYPLKQLARKFNIDYGTLIGRLDRGWSLTKALSIPPRKTVVSNS